MVMRRAACLAALALTGCDYLTSSFDTTEFSGDEYPVQIDASSGALIVGVQENGDVTRQAVLDVLSPLTVIDRGPNAAVSIETSDLTLLGARTPGGPLELPRAIITDQQVVTLHPCATAECVVGTEASPVPFDVVVGINAFGGDALRLRLADSQIFVLPGIAGSDLHRARSCDAVFDSPFRGGGTLVLGGTEVGFPNWRIAIDACIAPDPERLLAQSARGVNALFVLSTSIGTSLLGRAAYDRYRELDPTLPDAETLPVQTVLLPSGPVSGYATTLPSIALVGNSDSNPRAPCRQMWASHLLAARDCRLGDDCPCQPGSNFCGVPAVVELAPAGGIPVLIVANAEPTLQSLRAELRSDQPEVDGILGSDAIRALQLDIDVIHDRLVASCTDRTVCGTRAALPDRQARSYVNGCLGDMPGPIVLDDN